MIDCGYPVIAFRSYGSRSGFCTDRFDYLSPLPFSKRPASGNYDVIWAFILKRVIDLISVGYESSMKILKELSWIISFSGRLVFIYVYRRCTIIGIRMIDPHVIHRFRSLAIMDQLKRCLITMDNFTA